MDRIIISAQGYPLTQEWLTFLEKASTDQINGLVKAIGDNVIVAGMENTAGVIADGWLIYGNELIPFIGGVLGETVVIVETVTSAGYDTAEDDSFDEVLPVWKTRVAQFGDPGDTGVVDSFAFTVLERIDTQKYLKNKLEIIREGKVSLFGQTLQWVSSSGDFTGAEILDTSSALTEVYRVKLSFEPINGSYTPVVYIDNNINFLGPVGISSIAGPKTLSIKETASNYIIIDIHDLSQVNYFLDSCKVAVKLLGKSS